MKRGELLENNCANVIVNTACMTKTFNTLKKHHQSSFILVPCIYF